MLGIMSGVSNDHIRRAYTEHLLLSSASNSSSALFANRDVPDAITVAATLTFTIGILQVFFVGLGFGLLCFKNCELVYKVVSLLENIICKSFLVCIKYSKIDI